MLCSNKQMVLATNWKRFFEKASTVVFYGNGAVCQKPSMMSHAWLALASPLMQRKIDGLLILYRSTRYYSSDVALITWPFDKYCREHGYQPCNKQGQSYLKTVCCSP